MQSFSGVELIDKNDKFIVEKWENILGFNFSKIDLSL
jgi:hypothetical protein